MKKKKLYTVGIDIGGTTTKIGLVNCNNNKFVLERYVEVDTLQGQNNLDKMLEVIIKEINKFKKEITACGVGVAALINTKDGVVIKAPNVLWSEVNLKKVFHRKINLPIIVENDANVATVGIYHTIIKKKYPNCKNIICLTLGTGIGGGIIIDGKLLMGTSATAAEVGHFVIKVNGEKCGCGSYGCLERFIGARWFIKDIVETLKTSKYDTIIYELVNNDLSLLTPKLLYEAALKKDKFALEQWKKFGKYLAVGVCNLINILNPEIIVFTGGVAKASKFFLPFLKKEIKNYFWPVISKSKYYPAKYVKYIVVADKKIYGVIGAGILAYENFLSL
ncbi:MAG: ROK family protein [Endomicrobia bacterium]|nr:ROK family protein [Endomicrobiia bacterium]